MLKVLHCDIYVKRIRYSTKRKYCKYQCMYQKIRRKNRFFKNNLIKTLLSKSVASLKIELQTNENKKNCSRWYTK